MQCHLRLEQHDSLFTLFTRNAIIHSLIARNALIVCVHQEMHCEIYSIGLWVCNLVCYMC